MVFAGEGYARGERKVAADDAVATEHVRFRVEEMHRPAEALRAACLFAVQFGHRDAGRHTAGEGEAVVAIGRDGVVVFLNRGTGADRDRLLTNVKMKKSAYLSHRVGTRRFFLEPSNEEELPKEFKSFFPAFHSEGDPGLASGACQAEL